MIQIWLGPRGVARLRPRQDLSVPQRPAPFFCHKFESSPEAERASNTRYLASGAEAKQLEEGMVDTFVLMSE